MGGLGVSERINVGEEQESLAQGNIISRNVEGVYESLIDHINHCLRKVGEFSTKEVHRGVAMLDESVEVKTWLEQEIYYTIIVYHDMGKQTDAFQERVKHNTDKAVPHALHSAVSYLYMGLDNLDSEDPHYKQKVWWMYLLSYIIAQHHGTISIGKLYGHESSLIKYLEKEDFKQLGYESSDTLEFFIEFWQRVSTQREVTLREYQLLTDALELLRGVDHAAAEEFDDEVYASLLTGDDLVDIGDRVSKYEGLLNLLKDDYSMVIQLSQSIKNYKKALIQEKLKGKQVNA